jgi:hypothetical protein
MAPHPRKHRTCASAAGALAIAVLRAIAVVVARIGAAPRAARADSALNSNEKPPDGARDAQPPAAPKDDFTIVPVAGGSTDIGIGAGFFSALTRNRRGFVPYAWNVEAAAFVSFELGARRLVVPYTDDYAEWTVTRFLGRPIELQVRVDFTDEATLYYYGMGNASPASRPPGAPSGYFHYGRLHPLLDSAVVFKIIDHIAGQVGIRHAMSNVSVDANSKLAEDARTGSTEVKKLIGPLSGTQSTALFVFGARFDTRDNAVTPHSGTFDDARIKLSPGGAAGFPYRYGQVTAIARAYARVPGTSVTLAGRLVGDVLFGTPPFYELARFEDTYAVGGSNGVRGVPAQRYYGKAKLFGNLEARLPLFDFHVGRKKMTLGMATFFDAGRVWADTTPHPELDGTGLGIKFGVGAGLRLMSGTAFVLRGDIAWSPDATPLGGYVSAGEIF